MGSALVGSFILGVLAACGSTGSGAVFVPTPPDGGGRPDSTDPNFNNGGDTGSSGQSPYDNSKSYTDFASAPVVGAGAPANIAALFAAAPAASTVEPCVFEPEPLVKYPRNWVAPELGFTVADAQSNVIEVRVKAENQVNDLVYYAAITPSPGSIKWVMPDDVWEKLRTHSYDKTLTITLRAGYLASGGTALSSVSAPHVIDSGILPASADGSVVYFSTGNTEGILQGFSTGTENNPPGEAKYFGVVRGSDIAQRPAGTANCVGCHSGTPDTDFMMVGVKKEPADGQPSERPAEEYSMSTARVNNQGGAAFGSKPSYVSDAATAILKRQRIGATATSPAYWSDTDKKHLVLGWFVDETNVYPGTRKLRTLNLDDGVLEDVPMGGAPQGGMPVWSRDGKTIYYTAINNVFDGRLGNAGTAQTLDDAADVYALPYKPANPADAVAKPIAGAAKSNESEYYPAVSGDGVMLSFTRAGYVGGLPPYIQGNNRAMISVISSAGGTADPMTAANQAVQCGPGAVRSVNAETNYNRWSQWSPTPKVVPGVGTYYFLAFSSKRRGEQLTQLYVTPVLRKTDGSVQTFGALYIRSQDPLRDNHMPVWTDARVESNPGVQ